MAHKSENRLLKLGFVLASIAALYCLGSMAEDRESTEKCSPIKERTPPEVRPGERKLYMVVMLGPVGSGGSVRRVKIVDESNWRGIFSYAWGTKFECLDACDAVYEFADIDGAMRFIQDRGLQIHETHTSHSY